MIAEFEPFIQEYILAIIYKISW